MSEKKFKILIFGDGGVGKTTLVNRYLTGVYTTGAMTIGVDFHLKMINVDEKVITLQIWDFAGEDRFRFLLPSYVPGSDGAIFMYDVTRYSSIKNISDWLSVFEKGLESKNEKIPLLMVGSKIDLDLERSVSFQDAQKVANEYDFFDYIECSSKTGKNVEEIFKKIGKKIMNKIELQ